jgi:hypothetical protein
MGHSAEEATSLTFAMMLKPKGNHARVGTKADVMARVLIWLI